MEVIGAGLPRTGTASMQAALNHLGFPCYHMETVARTPSHLTMWDDYFSERTPMDWALVFQNYSATVDAPACYYYQELMAEYPDAKVILTVRDEERWYLSLMKLYNLVAKLRIIGMVVPRLGRFVSFGLRTFHRISGKVKADKADFIDGFRRHNSAVQAYVPADRLLVFQVADGWEPLCAGLGVDVPDRPCPHLNSGDETLKKKFKEIFLNNRLTRLLPS